MSKTLADLESRFRALQSRLSKNDKAALDKQLASLIEIEGHNVEKHIDRDKRHLTIVNFCADRFSTGSWISRRTEYVWIRVEPLFGLGIKTFDLAVYNKSSKVMILIECKSSILEAEKEIDELIEKIGIMLTKKDQLETMIGDEIKVLEFALCVSAGNASQVRPLMVSKQANCCLWSADIFEQILILEKLADNIPSEIASGRLHHDGILRSLLLEGSREGSSLRIVTFLPSSHMATILEELIPQLQGELQRSKTNEFDLQDITTLIGREKSLQNLDPEEQIRLAGQILISGLENGVVVERVTGRSNIYEKRFRLTSHGRDPQKLLEDCHNRYVEHHAREKALEILLKQNRDKHPDITNYSQIGSDLT